MKLKEGEKIPKAKLILVEKEHKEINTSEILDNNKVILFGLPGAFTPTCSNKHLPSFLEIKEELKNLEECLEDKKARTEKLTRERLRKICIWLRSKLSSKLLCKQFGWGGIK